MARGDDGLPEIPGYRLEGLLGKGGMGHIYLGVSASGRKVAVKVIRKDVAHQPEFQRRFRQEVTAARRVSGAFTAPVVDADPDADPPWMATQYIPGKPLSTRVKEGPSLAGDELRLLAVGLAEALRDIHRAGIVHRDLKPANVLLSAEGPRVIDFGIVRATESDVFTQTGVAVGTPPFMSPEQVRAQKDVGPASDVFSLGSVLAYAATGRMPFGSSDVYAVAYQLVHEEPDLEGVPDQLVGLIRRCLQKNPEHRPVPDELLAELAALAPVETRHEPIPGSQPEGPALPGDPASLSMPALPSLTDTPPPGTARRRYRRRRTIAAATAVAAVTVLATAGINAMVRNDPPPQSRTGDPGGRDSDPTRRPGAGTEPRVKGPGEPYQPVLGGSSGRTFSHADAPSRLPAGWKPWRTGEKVDDCVYADASLFCWGDKVRRIDARTGQEKWSRALNAYANPPAVMGDRVVVDDGEAVRGLSADTGKVLWTYRTQNFTQQLTVSGSTVYAATHGGQVFAVDGRTGTELWTHRVAGHSTGYPPSLRPLGDSLYVLTGRDSRLFEATVLVLDAATGRQTAEKTLPKGCSLDSAALSTIGGHPVLHCVAFVDEQQNGNGVLRFDVASGKSTYTPLPWARSSLAVQGDTVYLVTGGDPATHLLTAVDTRQSRIRWQTRVPKELAAPTYRLLVAGGQAYLLSVAGEFRVDVASERVAWRQRFATKDEYDPLRDDGRWLSEPVVVGGVLFAPSPYGGWRSADTATER